MRDRQTGHADTPLALPDIRHRDANTWTPEFKSFLVQIEKA
jgi:hypothetical protein